jgi:hypothetical protein
VTEGSIFEPWREIFDVALQSNLVVAHVEKPRWKLAARGHKVREVTTFSVGVGTRLVPVLDVPEIELTL